MEKLKPVLGFDDHIISRTLSMIKRDNSLHLIIIIGYCFLILTADSFGRLARLIWTLNMAPLQAALARSPDTPTSDTAFLFPEATI